MAFDAPAPFELTPKQIEQRDMLASAATWCFTYGGARSGKTFGYCRAIATRAIMAPGSRHLIARFRTNAVKRSIGEDTWPKMMSLCFPSLRYEYNKSEGCFKFPAYGSEVLLSGLDTGERIDKILGTEFATVFLNEASEIPWDTVEVLETRLAQNALIKEGPRKGHTLRHKMYGDLNPGSKRHWSHKLLKEKLHPKEGVPLANPGDYTCMQINPKDNPHLDARFLLSLQRLSKLKRRRFWEGEYNGEVDGALWSEAMFKRCTKRSLPHFVRLVIAVDPSGAKNAKDVTADEIGIVIAALGEDGVMYVLEDLSLRTSPAVWGNLIAAAWRRSVCGRKPDAVLVEDNFGGPLVEAVLRQIEPNINVRAVHASSGKHVRAEPIAALYERGLVRHAGEPLDYEALEDQLMQFTAAGYMGVGSPDRGDALVWAGTDLMLETVATASGGRSFGS